ncbi:UbiD family decarboxylase [Ochrobactrum pecoris]|uniref:4-hydroxy-3-polyprenylbenzoate decarboxylase n=1 Tax=Brucella pecoris TaxID=867683 RepID=A0A5C5CD37_9HYPH|nr:UbiD family decarboxylase [Brucella pecoris]MBB4095589.1 4-hydroxy-3-polyprenylbenzoate decarboxylase [Brucella pecoris]NKW82615.1 UbiD family decarboxylase [Brucella pecoris]TNV09232.1 UbiD family decarboxylase [Brucella pecoris]
MKTPPSSPLHYDCLQSFLSELERRNDLVRIKRPVSLVQEITEIHKRVLEMDGPALLFEQPVDADGRHHSMPLVANLFGSERRIALGFGCSSVDGISDLANMLAELRAPTPPRSAGEVWSKLPLAKATLNMRLRHVRRASVQATILEGEDVNLDLLPIQWCWPGEPAPLVTWPLIITRAPDDPPDINVGIYRMQKLGPDKLIMRWLAHRGGARHHRMWQRRGEDMPVAVAIGADPATILSAVMPLPEGMSELAFSGLLAGRRLSVVDARTVPLAVPANAEIILEGRVSASVTAPEGPYGDHTGYYNSVEDFPVIQVTAMTMRKNPVYLSTYTGRPPDEPARLGKVMNELFVPIVRKQFPEIADLWLPPAACSYRAMVVSIDKRYPGQARRVMMGLWSMLPQFSYTKLIIAVDPDINVRNWDDVMWALSTRFDASRDVVTLADTPVDYLDFASPRSGLGGKLGLDATNKIGAETEREWGTVLGMSDDVIARVDAMWHELGLDKGKMQ